MSKKPEPMPIRRIGRNGMYLRLPPSFVEANDLEPGDYIVLDRDRFRIMKAEDFALIGREPAPELEAAE
jgi:hypothetical protein